MIYKGLPLTNKTHIFFTHITILSLVMEFLIQIYIKSDRILIIVVVLAVDYSCSVSMNASRSEMWLLYPYQILKKILNLM